MLLLLLLCESLIRKPNRTCNNIYCIANKEYWEKPEKTFNSQLGLMNFRQSPFGLLCPVLLRIIIIWKPHLALSPNLTLKLRTIQVLFHSFFAYIIGGISLYKWKYQKFQFFSLEQSFLVCQILLQITRDKRLSFVFSLVLYFLYFFEKIKHKEERRKKRKKLGYGGEKKKKKERNVVCVWGIKKRGKKKRRKCYHNIFSINFKW